MGPEDPSNRKKYTSFFLKPNVRILQDDSKGWGLSAKLGKHSAIWGKLGTALQAYALNPCIKFPQIPLLEKSTLKG